MQSFFPYLRSVHHCSRSHVHLLTDSSFMFWLLFLAIASYWQIVRTGICHRGQVTSQFCKRKYFALDPLLIVLFYSGPQAPANQLWDRRVARLSSWLICIVEAWLRVYTGSRKWFSKLAMRKGRGKTVFPTSRHEFDVLGSYTLCALLRPVQSSSVLHFKIPVAVSKQPLGSVQCASWFNHTLSHIVFKSFFVRLSDFEQLHILFIHTKYCPERRHCLITFKDYFKKLKPV